MNTLRISLALTLLAFTVTSVHAQNAVQLPTLSSFRTGTTISVPDRGSVFTGGINRAADGRSEFGTPLLPFRNRSMGSQRSASSVWTSVYIHDFEAMDEALLGQARGSSYRAPAPRPLGPSSLVSGTQRSPRETQPPRIASGPSTKSVAQLRAERAGEQQTRIAEAERLFERGKAAEAKGKPNVARIYYQQASRRAQGEFKEQILAQLRLVSETSVAQR